MYREVVSLDDVFARKINIRGPIAVTKTSHPFSAMEYSRAKINVDDYGYLEEEYFVSGYSNVYDLNEKNNLVVKKENLPYETRILVRRPKNSADRKNIVVFDIMNASNCYDIEDQWRRSYLHIMERGYSYVGITSKPVNVLSLKNFDYERYQTLNWSNGEVSTSPSVIDKCHRIEGCEEGLVWDMLTSLGLFIQNEGKNLFTKEEKVYIYLTGQSQSGMYLNTYVNQFHHLLKVNGKSIFDGYLSLVSGGKQRALCQTHEKEEFMCLRDYVEREIDVPFITMNTEGDYLLFKPMGGLKQGINSDEPNNKRRYYDVAGAPHTDAASPLVPDNSEIVKTKCPKRILDGEYDYKLNDLPLDYTINGLLEKLHTWAKDGIAPLTVKPMLKDENGEIARDEYGNALGGIRTAYLEVPNAKYVGSIGLGETNGTMELFTEDVMNRLYGSKEEYIKRFEAYGKKQVSDGDITENDFKRMMNKVNS